MSYLHERPDVRQWLAGVLAKTDPPPIDPAQTWGRLSRTIVGQTTGKQAAARFSAAHRPRKPRRVTRPHGAPIPIAICPARACMATLARFTSRDLTEAAPELSPKQIENRIGGARRKGLIRKITEARCLKAGERAVWEITPKFRRLYGLPPEGE